MSKAYLLGALHDATERKYTFRLGQKSQAYVEFIADLVRKLNHKAWTYREGKNRNLFIVEFSKTVLSNLNISTTTEKINYIRGYFDAEGGMSKSPKTRFYLYFAQKNKSDVNQVRNYLLDLGISCGVLHNPSSKADPNYWRFFVLTKSHKEFAKRIGSWHPEKSEILRMKI